MIFPKSSLSLREKFVGYFRLLGARKRFFERYVLAPGRFPRPWRRAPGYHERIAALAGKHKGRRGFILGNGPSLAAMNLAPLRNEITIGSNGIYRKFAELGFATTYFTMEDMQQVEDRRFELDSVRGPLRIFALDNAYCIRPRADTLFMPLERDSYPFQKRWREFYPQFSVDFASVVYLGSTVTYINLQLAFFLGLNPVYLIGVDHNYGKLAELFPPGKITITEEVAGLLKEIHFVGDYHRIGGSIGIPYVKEQEAAFRKALDTYHQYGREVFNAGVNSQLDVFPRAEFATLFS